MAISLAVKEAIQTDVKSSTLAAPSDDVPDEVRASVDRLLDFMLENNIAPRLCVRGETLSAVINIIEQFSALFPPHLHNDIRNVFNYLIEWFCHYAEKTGQHVFDMHLDLKEMGKPA